MTRSATLPEALCFTLAAGGPPDPGAAVTKTVPPGDYELRTTEPVLVREGAHQTLKLTDPTVLPAAPLRLRVRGLQLTLAAAGASAAIAWLLPLAPEVR